MERLTKAELKALRKKSTEDLVKYMESHHLVSTNIAVLALFIAAIVYALVERWWPA